MALQNGAEAFVESDAENLINNNQDVMSQKPQRFAKSTLVLMMVTTSMVTCLVVGILIKSGIAQSTSQSDLGSHMHKIAPQVPMLQAYIAWNPKMRSIMQKNGLPNPESLPDSPKGLLQEPKKLMQLAKALFNEIDADGSGDLSYEEVEAAFKLLIKEGVIDAPPSENVVFESVVESSSGERIGQQDFVHIFKGVLHVEAAHQSIQV